MDVVWFKRDLRVRDHAPLAEAARGKGCLCLYVLEDEVREASEYQPQHDLFLNQSLMELRDNLRQRGGDLCVIQGSIPDVFHQIHKVHPIERILSHEETGNGLTYARDLRLKEWLSLIHI